MSDSSPSRRRPHLHGRRKAGKFSAHQQSLLDQMLPGLAWAPAARPDPKGIFGSASVGDVWLEIGFGGGEHLLWQVEHHASVGIIGAEPYVSGVVKLLNALEQKPHEITSRIRIHMGDAREVIETLPDHSIGRLFILFPDPWPKTRHHKRRFVQMEMLDGLARILKPGAELRFASDDPSYVIWALERLMAHPAFHWTAETSRDWMERPADWPPTRYEAKRLHGRPYFFRFRRL